MSGRAQTPLRAFLKALERLATHEARGVAAPLPRANGEPLGFRMGPLVARCNRCDGAEFAAAEPEQPLRLLSRLVCRGCGEQVIHSNLIAQLAQDTVHYSHALSAATTAMTSSRANIVGARLVNPQQGVAVVVGDYGHGTIEGIWRSPNTTQ